MYNRFLVAVVAVVLVGSVFVSPVVGATSVEDADEPKVQVEMTSDGDATVSLVSIYDLGDEDEQTSFELLAEDEEAQDDLRDRFTERMESVAENSGHDGEAVIDDASIEIRSEDGYGVVTVVVTWSGLAEGDGEMLVLTEPFVSGFELDRQLVITGPDDATIESTSHDPDEKDSTQVSWDPDTDLDGFELVISLEDAESDTVAETDSEDEEETADGVPGFGIGVALVALVAGLGIASRRLH
ncbi:DUF7345 domain-containing protein [Natrarchaeobius oligotrophus]|uniref:PGF-CTERM sorting domain-containing protein n=1 Tax=Natrarchaeobius chitinivorans TaxID=1679083 RepID=A0A3N6M4W5_NATCH|nr:PGF-CTERM sorting domain-containing protein [Natrarchaeobius chitinivorans]RQG98588.1 PGF-CTERM sorting domain-containing protein [Natrarchaeobius chitinivorans]